MTRWLKKTLYLAVVIAMSLSMVLGGCSSEEEETPQTRTVTDSEGNPIEIPYNVERVAPQIGAMAHMTALLGYSNRLVATAFGDTNEYFNKVFPDYVKANPRGLTTGNVEDIIASGAQVVYGPVRDQAVIDQLNAAGIAVVKLASFSTIEEMKSNIREIAKINGGNAPHIAEDFCEYYQGNIDYVSEKTAHLQQSEKVRILMLNYRAGALSTINAADICSVYITEAGGINVAAEAEGGGSTPGTSISAEDVIKWNPEIILTHNLSGKEQILAEPTFQTLPAIKNNKVFIVPTGTYLWSVRSAEGSMMCLWLAKTMYPEIFKDLDMAKKIREFYKTFHSGYEIPDDEIDMVLAGNQN
ncbi:MAG: ABC transporter substrate-binding protein [Dehalococcoidales bacterium]|nr:ABC transporter substrate-binding protein [Dehalococcoidales bacterium]